MTPATSPPSAAQPASTPTPVRARDLGLRFDGDPGPWNALTDVAGVEVGHVTLVSGDGPLVVGEGPVRTGVTAVLPTGRAGLAAAVASGWFSLNGNGEMTGTHWLTETGGLCGPVMITNTHSIGPVHQGVIDWAVANNPELAAEWVLPVVAETWDGYLNDINGGHVRPEHAAAAIEAAASGPVAEGSVGGGTGMNCYGFKGGAGTSSRRVQLGSLEYTVGAYVEANFGRRAELRLGGHFLGDLDVPCPMENDDWYAQDLRRGAPPGGAGSVIVLIATDAPLLPAQCTALARRASLGLARTGTTGSHFSGDLFLAWSTASPGALNSRFPLADLDLESLASMSFVPWGHLDPLYAGVVHAVEEAVANALVNNTSVTGRDGHRSPALPHDLVRARLARR